MANHLLSFIVIASVSCAMPTSAQNLDCDLGAKLRSLASADDKVLTQLVSDTLFARDDEKFVDALIQLKATDKILNYISQTNVKLLTSAARERRANALLKVVNYAKDKVIRHLYVDLAETQAARAITPIDLSEKEWLRRMEVLSERNDNAAVISQIVGRKKLSAPNKCRAQFLLGRAYRKNRNYSESQKVLDSVARSCGGAEELDASFLLARLAAISPSQENMKYFEAFKKKHSKHSYLDDVLLFKASALETMGRREEAKRTLQEIWNLEQVADMRFEAIFRLAFLHAVEGDSERASAILRSSLSEKRLPAATYFQVQRAKYWVARLQLYPQLANLKKKSEKGTEAALRTLEDLAKSRNPTYYSWLAAELLQKEGIVPGTRAAPQVTKSSEIEIKDPNFKTLFCMFAKGFEKEAAHYIQLIEPSDVEIANRIPVARKLNELGLFADAFRFAITTSEDDRTLLYPRAYASQVEEASAKVGPSQFLLYGLMREESRFDARAISWAGAHGVLQLMPSVAKEEGRKFKMGELSKENMLDPKINILLGAEHLKGMMNDVKHPLFAVAAYNAGLDRVKRWEQRFQNYEVLDSFVENIPLPETRDYVKRVAGSWVNYSQLYSSNDKPFGIEIRSR